MSIVYKIKNWFKLEASGGSDNYCDIRPSYRVEEATPIPYKGPEVPNLGNDHDKLVKRAEVMYTDDTLRYKWLVSIHTLRIKTKNGWWVEGGNGKNKVVNQPLLRAA